MSGHKSNAFGVCEVSDLKALFTSKITDAMSELVYACCCVHVCDFPTVRCKLDDVMAVYE